MQHESYFRPPRWLCGRLGASAARWRTLPCAPLRLHIGISEAAPREGDGDNVPTVKYPRIQAQLVHNN